MSDIFEEVVKLKSSNLAGVMVTVVHKEGHAPAPIGARLLVYPTGDFTGTVGGGALEHEALREAREAFGERKSFLKKYSLGEEEEVIDPTGTRLGMPCGGNITLFFEYIGAADQLIIFGAGHLGQAILYHLRGQKYAVTMVDSRKALLKKCEQDFGFVRGMLMEDFGAVAGRLNVQEGSFLVVATHSHELDYAVLKAVFESGWKPAYIGVVASGRKAESMVERLLRESGTELDLRSLYMPVGLELGGASPDEIALSILSEIQAVRYGKNGHRHMRRDPSTL